MSFFTNFTSIEKKNFLSGDERCTAPFMNKSTRSAEIDESAKNLEMYRQQNVHDKNALHDK